MDILSTHEPASVLAGTNTRQRYGRNWHVVAEVVLERSEPNWHELDRSVGYAPNPFV
jgi:hypothetical protein